MHMTGMDNLDTGDPSGTADGQIGTAYGAFILAPLTRWIAATQEIELHYLLSSWRPYQVHHVRTVFTPLV